MVNEALSLDQTCWIVVIQNLNFQFQICRCHPVTCKGCTERGVEEYLCSCLSSVLEGLWYSTPRLRRFIPGKEPRYPWYTTLGGPKGPSGLVWRRENLLVPPEFKPRNFQSAASPCIDYAVLARSSIIGPVSIIDIYSHLNKWLPILQTFLRSSNLMRRSVNSDLYGGWW